MATINRKARFTYKLERERIEAGIALTGGEVKVIKTGKGDLSASHARIIKGEAYLINANITVVGAKNHNPTRTRKLLLHKSEIISLSSKMKQRKLTLVPLKLYTKGRFVKAQLALGKIKKKYEKRESIKKKDIEREIERELKDI